MMRGFASLLIALSLTACVYPTSRTDQGTPDGLLNFSAIPGDARITVDGQDAGVASAYQGANALSVRPGTHRIVVSRAGSTLLDKKYYVDAGANVAVRND